MMQQETKAYLWGLLGVSGFALTLPATKAAVVLFGFTFVGIGRAAIAGFLSLILLTLTRSKFPSRQQLPRLAIVAFGVIFGFPCFSAYAMQYVPASHGAIVIGILPLFTALFGVLFAREKPSLGYWLSGFMGSTAIILYSLYHGGGTLHLADVALLLAVVSASVGYAEGARLAKELGSWRVICYALVLSLPITLPVSIASLEFNPGQALWSGWIGFLYVSCISMFLAFFAWYRGLELGGIARVGQLQLLQPFITLVASSLLFHETLSPIMGITLGVVILSVYLGRKSRVFRPENYSIFTE